MNPFQSVRRIAAIVFFVALSGCASTSLEKGVENESLTSGGIIVVSASHDLSAPYISKAIFYIDGGIPRGGKMIFSIDELIPGVPKESEFNDSNGHLLVLALPVGVHTFDSWQLTTGNARVYPNKKPTPLKFEVVRGKITYLGNLHAHMRYGKTFFGAPVVVDGNVQVNDKHERDIPLFEEKYPQYKGKISIDLLAVGPWL